MHEAAMHDARAPQRDHQQDRSMFSRSRLPGGVELSPCGVTPILRCASSGSLTMSTAAMPAQHVGIVSALRT